MTTPRSRGRDALVDELLEQQRGRHDQRRVDDHQDEEEADLTTERPRVGRDPACGAGRELAVLDRLVAGQRPHGHPAGMAHAALLLSVTRRWNAARATTHSPS